MYGVEGDNDDAGTNVATKPFNDTAPAIGVSALSFSVNVEVLTVAGCTASLNVDCNRRSNCNACSTSRWSSACDSRRSIIWWWRGRSRSK